MLCFQENFKLFELEKWEIPFYSTLSEREKVFYVHTFLKIFQNRSCRNGGSFLEYALLFSAPGRVHSGSGIWKNKNASGKRFDPDICPAGIPFFCGTLSGKQCSFAVVTQTFSSGDPAPDPAAALPDPTRNFYEQKTDRTHLFSSKLAQVRSNTPVRAGPLKSFRI